MIIRMANSKRKNYTVPKRVDYWRTKEIKIAKTQAKQSKTIKDGVFCPLFICIQRLTIFSKKTSII